MSSQDLALEQMGEEGEVVVVFFGGVFGELEIVLEDEGELEVVEVGVEGVVVIALSRSGIVDAPVLWRYPDLVDRLTLSY